MIGNCRIGGKVKGKRKEKRMKGKERKEGVDNPLTSSFRN